MQAGRQLKTTLVSNRNGFVFVSHACIFTLRTPTMVDKIPWGTKIIALIFFVFKT